MKKSIIISFAVLGIIFLSSMIINGTSAWSSQKEGTVSKPIPSNVMAIAEASCADCHSDGGNVKAMMNLNLSNWGKYSPEKQAEKASDMCKMVTKGKMPPKGYREKNPGSIPTADEIKIICDWANSIKVVK